ncbi:MAG TPA: rod shape-determining protein MreC [Chlorobaculum parvum]|uniref:Cell shape-determining protein MreC n=1 Tax=Chlorobaculum parvum TaxID=274539 RepID=A0A7C5DFP5_9CHLB|nr:rod shape-determining protein MreC [Chlorobaculum parvum]
MTSFFRFIAKHTAYLYFLIYCSLSIAIMQLERKETLDAIRERGLAINAAVAEQMSGLWSLFTLKQNNERLFLQNARLMSKLLQQELALHDIEDRQSLVENRPDEMSRFTIARVVDRRFSATDNMLIIDVGKNNGISKEQSVMTPDGLVGRIIEVSDNYAKVLPIINRNLKVSVVTDSTRTNGLLSWSNGNERIAHIEHVPISGTLLVGEGVSTSDYSTFACRGIPVGTIERISKDKLFYNVDIRLGVDFSSLNQVMVCPAKPSQEKLELMQSHDSPEKEE